MKKDSQFLKFEAEVKKYDFVSTEELTMLIRRITTNTGKRIFALGSPRESYEVRQATARGNYYRFWIRRLEKRGTITLQGAFVWKVNKG